MSGGDGGGGWVSGGVAGAQALFSVQRRLPAAPSADAMRPHRSRTPPPPPPDPPPPSSPTLRSPRRQLRPTRRAAVACWRRPPRLAGSAPARSCRRRRQACPQTRAARTIAVAAAAAALRQQRAVRRRAEHVAGRRPGATDRTRAGVRGEREGQGARGEGRGVRAMIELHDMHQVRREEVRSLPPLCRRHSVGVAAAAPRRGGRRQWRRWPPRRPRGRRRF